MCQGRAWHSAPQDGDAKAGTVPTRQRLDMMNEGLQRQARESRGEIPFACDAIMYEQYAILYYIVGPPVGDPTAMYAPPLRYKREARAVHHKENTHRLGQALADFLEAREYKT